MQPKVRMKKTLQVSTLVLSLGSAFHASSEIFTVTAGAIPDVNVTQNSTLAIAGTELSFGTSVKLNPAAGSTCTITGASEALEDEFDINLDGTAAHLVIGTQAAAAGSEKVRDITGNGCIADTAGAQSGSVMVFDIDGADASTVSVSIPDVVGTGWTYSPGAETCVTKFTRSTAADTCETFAGKNVVTGVAMAAADSTEEAATDALNGTAGGARLLLAGTLTFDGTAVTAPAGEVVTVTVTYE